MNFQKLRLAEPIVRAVAGEGYTTPTPIQAQAIPHALGGRDVLACAQTGTGKTCAFALPILQRLAGVSAENATPARHAGRGRLPRALVLCPTRELATQIHESFVAYGQRLPLRHAVVFGGVNQFHQVKALRAGIDVLIATPGRLLDLINQGHIDLGAIETLVLDEADRMLDMGFIHDIRKVCAMIPRERQTLLFSATVSREIRTLAGSLLRDPVTVETTPESTTVETINQRAHRVERNDKPELLERLLTEDHVGRALVFTRTKHGADRVVRRLNQSGIDAAAIHGNKTQSARTRTMNAFRSGRVRVLIATDIASRGIDVDEITHVFNYDMPADAETYVHRIGRTARAGASGVAVTFFDRSEHKALRDIEKRTGVRIEIEGEAGRTTGAEPSAPRRNVKPRRNPGSGQGSKSKPSGPSGGRRTPRSKRGGKPNARPTNAGHHHGTQRPRKGRA